MRRLTALVIAAGLMDLTAYLFFYACSALALQRDGFSAGGTLLLGAWFDLVYSAACLGTGGRSEGRSRQPFLIVGGGLVVAVGFGAALAPAMGVLIAGIAVKGFALSQWWPNLQARLGDLADGPDALHNHLGVFNLGWCTGKGIGLALAGVVGAGPFTFALAAVIAAAATVFGAIGSAGPVVAARAPAATGERGPGFLLAGRLANFTWWGVGILAVWAMSAHIHGRGLAPGVGAAALSVMFLSQAGVSTVLWRTHGWRYRVEPLLILQCTGTVGLVLLAWGPSPGVLIAGAVACGGALGMAYYASIFYSLDAPAARGRTTARHEAVLAAGGVCVPFAGALAAWGTDATAAPFWLAVALTLAVLPIQVAAVRARG